MLMSFAKVLIDQKEKKAHSKYTMNERRKFMQYYYKLNMKYVSSITYYSSFFFWFFFL